MSLPHGSTSNRRSTRHFGQSEKSNKENAQIFLPIEKKNFAIQKPIAPQPDLVSATPNPNPRIPYNPEKEKKYHVQTNERITANSA